MEPVSAKINKYLLPFFSILILLFLPAISGCQRYAANFIGIPSIGAADLHKTIKSNAKPLIIDIREDRLYRKGHIPGAIRVDMESIEGYLEKIQIPHQRVIVTVCANGWQSQIAAASIMAHGYRKVYNLTGGTNRWVELGYPFQPAAGLDPAADNLKPPVIKISLLSQLAMTLAAFVVKPVYIVMTFLIIVMLWRKKSRDLVLIRYAMVLFFIGCFMAQRFLEFVHRISSISDSGGAIFYHFLLLDAQGTAHSAKSPAALFPCAGFYILFLFSFWLVADIQRKSSLGGLVGRINRIHHGCIGDDLARGIQKPTRAKNTLESETSFIAAFGQ